MPFTMSSSNLPSYIVNKPDNIKKKWIKIFNDVYADKGEETAFIVANKWLSRELENAEKFVRRTIRFDIDKEHLIKRTEEGEEYLTAVLATTEEHGDKLYRPFTPELLQSWADQINTNPIVGDFDHELLDKLQDAYVSNDSIKTMLKNKNGVAKAIKAIYEKGKLFVKLMIDKRYRKKIMDSRGLSVEAITTLDENRNVLDGEILGFTFGVNDTPAMAGTGVMT